MAYDTLESAQERILELEELNSQLTAERDTLSQNNESLTADNERLRTKNQDYFNRLVAQDDAKNKKEDETDEPLTCEEFAKTITKLF